MRIRHVVRSTSPPNLRRLPRPKESYRHHPWDCEGGPRGTPPGCKPRGGNGRRGGKQRASPQGALEDPNGQRREEQDPGKEIRRTREPSRGQTTGAEEERADEDGEGGDGVPTDNRQVERGHRHLSEAPFEASGPIGALERRDEGGRGVSDLQACISDGSGEDEVIAQHVPPSVGETQFH